MVNTCNGWSISFALVNFAMKLAMTQENIQESENRREDDCKKNWALVPYESTNVQLFPSFSEKIRKFKFKNIDDEILIHQNWNEKGVAAVVWEAAIELTNYIIDNVEVKGKRILELGSGTGLVGIACSKLGANVTVTDLREALPFLSKNIDVNFDLNRNLAPEVKELKWGDNLNSFTPENYDIIIGADVIYIEETFEDLLDTICYLSKVKGYSSIFHSNGEIINDKKTITYLSAKMRYTREVKFINKLKKNLNVKKVFSNRENNINIYKATPV